MWHFEQLRPVRGVTRSAATMKPCSEAHSNKFAATMNGLRRIRNGHLAVPRTLDRSVSQYGTLVAHAERQAPPPPKASRRLPVAARATKVDAANVKAAQPACGTVWAALLSRALSYVI